MSSESGHDALPASSQLRAAAEPPASNPLAATPLSEGIVTPVVAWQVVEASADGTAVVDGRGILVLVNGRMEELFGYDRAEMLGTQVELLIPGDLRAGHRAHRAGYHHQPRTRPMGTGRQLMGRRKDGSVFPAEISLSPIQIDDSDFTIALIRDVTESRRLEQTAKAAAVLARQEQIAADLNDTVISRLFHVGLQLQGAVNLPPEQARNRVLDAVDELDNMIRDIRNTVFTHRHADPGS